MNDLTPFYWLNNSSRTFLSRGYLKEGQTAEERYMQIALAAESILGEPGFADKFYHYLGQGFYSLSTPIICNFGNERGLPISCNGSYIADTMDSILYKTSEVGAMCKNGAGTSGYFGELRPMGAAIKAGGESSGPVHFLELFDEISELTKDGDRETHDVVYYMRAFDKVAEIISQGSARRGAFAAYLPITHPDIESFLNIQALNHPIKHMSFGVTISDEWMEGLLRKEKDKLKIWGLILKKRFETGYPYIMFSDTANNNAPQVYKDKGKKIFASNLCSEIMLSSSEDESFVCNLSSLNLTRWEAIKDTDAIETLTKFLDAVMTDYINKTEGMPFMGCAHNFAKRQRALGIGVLGWHSYLQDNMIAFESMKAKMLTSQIFSVIKERTTAASKEMAVKYGEPELMIGTGLRNATLQAIAPTTSSSFILGQVSPSIEPLNANLFVKDLAKGKFTFKNPALEKLLETLGKNDQVTWDDIMVHGGSVQHLSFLTQEQKDVFKTFGEISQKEILIQASIRQKFIDQGQSLNLMIPPKTAPKEVSTLVIEAWKLGLKSLYYQRSANPAQELAKNILACKACEA